MYKSYNIEDGLHFCQTGNLLYISHFLYEKDWVCNPHTHDFTELFFMINGTGFMNIRNAEIPAQKGDIFVVSPSVEHFEISDTISPMEYIVIGFNKLSFQYPNFEKGFFKISYKEKYTLFLLLFQTLLAEISNQTPGYKEICSNILLLIISYLTRSVSLSLQDEENTPIYPIQKDSNSFWIKQYIEENYKNNLNLDELANIIGINKFTMIRNFKQAFGITPISYIHSLQIESAKFLLTTTELSCKTIAETLGFNSSSYFAQFFKTHTGLSASEYREEHGIIQNKPEITNPYPTNN